MTRTTSVSIEKNTPLYTELDKKYQLEYYGTDNTSWYGRPFVGDELRYIYSGIQYLDFLDGGLSSVSKKLLALGEKPEPVYSQIIDLENLSKAQLRKSYRSLVNKGVCTILDKDSPIYLEPFRQLHKKVAGRETRSAKTWEIQEQMIQNGEAFAVFLGNWVSAGLFYYNKHICYYGVAASLEGAKSHPIIWTAMLHAKKLGCKKFEMGEQVYFGDEKKINISKFKCGFGGRTETRLLFGREE